MPKVSVPYGEKKVTAEIPEKNLALYFDPPFPPPVPDLSKEILRALENPVAGPPFSARIGKGKRVLLLVDNFARLTPAHRILPPVLEALKKAGCEVRILVASGGLREMNEAELNRKFGEGILTGGIP
ncbi:MAG TPA: lactate racemase domain-containing protein, partial [Thermodesulfobacteriota bacterium]|nr:lactate racemase domain-containing protein [Thermodesulfobacteriota bacterium]